MSDNSKSSASITRALVLYPDVYEKESTSPPYFRRTPQQCLEEAVSLSKAISSLQVVHADCIHLRDIKPSTLFGAGVVSKIGALITQLDADLVIVDRSLSPIQQRNLENKWSCKVIDRTSLILEIFGERAHTKEGALQVELAALTYQRSRLVRTWTHLERQRGGFGFMGGPGESQLEIDRRLIDERLTHLHKKLEKVKKTRGLHRKKRQQVPYPIVALVGYTNAGKSTLFNVLTRSEVAAEDMLFATLDPTMRKIKLPSGREVILSDTVGFISELPPQLVMAFRATLEEVQEADLLIHVRDISHPQTEIQAEDVEDVLTDLGIDTILQEGTIQALNKIDNLDEFSLPLIYDEKKAVPISALQGEGISDLLVLIDQFLIKRLETYTIDLHPKEGKALAWLYAHGEVIDREDTDEHIRLSVRMTEKAYQQYLKYGLE